ncbi:GntR family transcriptional regulator [Arcticibacterium luteifluviistationis]|uniref:Transcriptional regulator n=1 Tax=Arcticibacterium luteifluviistationis TaxID=1784714 RepID=A0A2Z4GGE8_9BACT|nr:winged helix-turn-helix domain-containing protein [Arcticibacterium luteifluviistationis]AWW00317.1 transcriptional regulator [Arcticibacterium luteifluviistationis]
MSVKLISINEFSATPKYQQLVNSILESIRFGRLKKGDTLPSINEVSYGFEISRITVEKGYNELRKRNFIAAHPGKGFFVINDQVEQDLKILLLFNKLSAHKKQIYDSLVAKLGNRAAIEFYIYNNDATQFCQLLENHKKGYSHYVIIPNFIEGDEQALKLINKLPKDQLIVIDKMLDGITGKFAAVYQPFEDDIFGALGEAWETLKKYNRMVLIFPENSYYPKDIMQGFINFCNSYEFNYKIINDIRKSKIRPGELYLNVMEDDLVKLLDMIPASGLKVGQDIGIISYNETPLKKFILNGITTISTDFSLMGEKAGELILNNKKEHTKNPFTIRLRASS